MAGLLDIPADLVQVQAAIVAGLERVNVRFDRQLRSDLPAVSRLVRHIETYDRALSRALVAAGVR